MVSAPRPSPSAAARRPCLRLLRFPTLTSILLVAAVCLPPARAAAAKRFDIPAGPATETLKRFSAETGPDERLLYSADAIADVTTRPVRGEMTPREALGRMLAGTALSVFHDPQTGALGLRRNDPPRPDPPPAPRTTAVPSTNETEDTIQLSPFIITTDSDVGYTATSTLSGSRIKTDFKDLASQVSVMTPEFLADIGAVNNDDAFLYSANTETAAEVAGTTPIFFGAGGSNSSLNRTRGLSGASNTRNFFKTDIPNDTYNTGEGGLTLASGPNAILFGLGSPAGLADTRYNPAQLRRTRGNISMMVDGMGSQRASIDYNRPLIADRLALRLSLLESDRRSPIKPAYEKDRRLYSTLAYAPHKRGRLDLFAEAIDRRVSRPIFVLPRDYVSPWTNPGIGNRTPYDRPDLSPTPLGQTLTTPNATSYLVNWTSGQTTGPVYTYGAGVAQPAVYSYRYTPAVRPLGQYLVNGLRIAEDFSNAMSFQDVKSYPFKSYSPYGASHPSEVKAEHLILQTTVNLARDLHLEAAANFERYRERQTNFYDATEALLTIDPSAYRYQPNFTPLDPLVTGAQQAANRAANAANRFANPLLGGYYLEGSGDGSKQERQNKEVRASLAYLFDASKRYPGGWLAWLGRHHLSTNVSYGEVQSVGQGFARLVLDDGTVNPATGFKNAPSVITAANARDTGSPNGRYMVQTNRLFRTRAYIDPNDAANRYDTMGGLDPFGTWTFQDANGRPYNVGLFDSGGGTSMANGRRSGSLSKSVAWQAYLLKERVVLTYGRRWDGVRIKEFDTRSRASDPRTGLSPHFDNVAWSRYSSLPTYENTSKSIVVHPLRWVSLFYNLSTNNEAEPSTAHDIDGALFPVPSGDNRDYGIRLQLGGVGVRINQFRTTQTNTDAGSLYGNAGYRRSLGLQETRFLEIQRARSLALGQPPYRDYYLRSETTDGFNPLDYPIDYYRVYTDSVAKGTEIELTGRIRRLDIRVSAGRTNSIKSNIGRQWLAYATDPELIRRMENLEWYAFDGTAQQYRPVTAISANGQMVFGAPGAQPLRGWRNIRNSDTGAAFANTMYSNFATTILPDALKLRQFDGVSNPAVREWRFNSTFAYNLGSGWRGGFSARMRDKGLIGYTTRPVTLDLAGLAVTTLATDIGSPLFNERAWYFDPFLSYTTRFGRDKRLTARLNIRNVLNQDDLIIVSSVSSTANAIDVNDPRVSSYGWTDPLNIPHVAQVQTPREFTFSVSLEF